MSELGVFKNELTDHTLAIKTGPDGWHTELICPDDCKDTAWHQDDWANNGADSIVSVDEEIIIGIVPVTVEEHGIQEETELWFRPVVPEGE